VPGEVEALVNGGFDLDQLRQGRCEDGDLYGSAGVVELEEDFLAVGSSPDGNL